MIFDFVEFAVFVLTKIKFKNNKNSKHFIFKIRFILNNNTSTLLTILNIFSYQKKVETLDSCVLLVKQRIGLEK